MSTENAEPDAEAAPPPEGGQYVVIARRYRPQSFDDLVGQQQVALALRNAIATNRVGHAYLFTGARGIGKTSTARILAKSLNCQQGPTANPCDRCDICRGVSSGEDVDVLEIDGASNRGIDEIRQLRSNVNIRPSRARYKIYIIDEVHMLTMPAFNALLKTLEEPPAHVKFIFCTTDPEKVPVTVLSRCQRFDFPPVEAASIADRLRHIVERENVSADDEALQLLARRAGGSMRDSQSLLEQLLSFCSEQITANDVHRLLGTAETGRLAAMVDHLIARSGAGAMGEVERAIAEGVDVGQLAEQLVGHFRDMMAAVVGCEADLLLYCPETEFDALKTSGQQMGLETILATIQILDHSLTRMRQSTHVRTLLEIALVRICGLESLDDLSQLVSQFRRGSVPQDSAAPQGNPAPTPPPPPHRAPAQKKIPDRTETPSESRPNVQSAEPLTADSAERLWKQALLQLGDMTADHGARYDQVAISGPNALVVSFKAAYTLDKERCERPDGKARLESALSNVAGQPVRVSFQIIADSAKPAPRKPPPSRLQRMKQKESHPIVRKAIELFEAEITNVEEPRNTDSD